MKQAEWLVATPGAYHVIEARLCDQSCPYHPHGKWRLYVDGQQIHPADRSLAKALGRARKIVKRRNRS